MPTSLHLPDDLLAELDRRARALNMSRNRFIVRTLEHALAESSEWSPGFFEALEDVRPEDARAVDEMRQAITGARRSKGPVTL